MIKNFLPTLLAFMLAYADRHFLLVHADDELARSILGHMEDVAKNMRDEIERVYTQRCYSDTLQNCGSKNYNDCSSEFPNPEGSKVSIDKCKCGCECVEKAIVHISFMISFLTTLTPSHND
jgi:hypothetical protein